jgi:transcriptional regulator with XRE-family HTH domain
MDELARCLRTWRDRLTPADVGLPAGGRRRAPGLRREELARLAGVSLDYLARLEQGRASNPSPSVLAPLARALRLDDAERAHLYRVAGQAPPSAGTIDRHITPGVQRVLDRLADVPVIVFDAAWTVVAANDLGRALVGAEEGANIARRHFTGAASRVARAKEDDAAF